MDGDDRFTESRLAGWFDPPLVLRLGYRDEAFVAGPLVRAMRERPRPLPQRAEPPAGGGAEPAAAGARRGRACRCRTSGEVRAAEGFQVVATQNPAEYVATGHLSEAVRDRFEHLEIGYQTAAEEEAIVAAATGCRDAGLVRAAVRLARATRLHPRVRRGASVRGAIAIVELTRALDDARAAARPQAAGLRRAAAAALATRVELRDADGGLDALLDELVELVVERGEDPDATFAAGGRAARRSRRGAASGPPRRTGRRSAAAGATRPSRRACTLEDRRALAEQLRAAPEDLDGWKLAADLSAGVLTHAGERAYLCARQLAAGAVLRRAAPPRRPAQGVHEDRARAAAASPGPASSTWRRRSTTCSASRTRSPAT